MRKNMKVVFMGTPEFAKESLKELVDSGYNVVACFTNPDKPSGRGMKLKASPVKDYAIENNIPIYQPKKVRNNQEVLDLLNGLNPDFIAVVAYGKILPKEILDVPRFGCINVHGSLLPKYRGAAPMQWSIINGEKTTGITTMFMDVGMDTGDMILKEEMEIKDEYNLENIHDILMVMGAKLLIKTLDKILDGTAPREKQPEEGTYAPMITREMTKINFNKKAREIFNFIRGLTPFPGTYMELEDGRKFKVFSIEYIESDEYDNKCGEIVEISKDTFSIKCINGIIKVLEIQPENSKRMDIKAFIAGNKIERTDRFI